MPQSRPWECGNPEGISKVGGRILSCKSSISLGEAWIFKACWVYPSDVCQGPSEDNPARPFVHRQDEPTKLSLGVVASQQSPLLFHLVRRLYGLCGLQMREACSRRMEFGCGGCRKWR